MVDMENALRSVMNSFVADGKMTTEQGVALNAWEHLKRQTSYTRRASVGGSLLGGSTPPSSGNAPSIKAIKGFAGNLAGQAQGWLAQAAASKKVVCAF